MSPRYEPVTLATETLEWLHEELVEMYAETGDRIGAGVRDPGALDSASNRPLTAFGGEVKYGSVYESAAALGHSIVNNHPFLDGNKRTALVAMIALMDREHVGLAASNRDAADFMLHVAQHELLDGFDRLSKPEADDEVREMASYLRANCRKTPAGERQLAYRELLHALRLFDVEEDNPKKGNAINFLRTLEDGSVLRSQIGMNGSRKMNVDPATVRKVRTELQLDEAHGVDHARFYQAAPPLNDFLIEFRGALDALAEYDRSGRLPDHIAERQDHSHG